MKRPWGVHTIRDVVGSANCRAGLPDGRYVRAVPEPYTANRAVAAWWVFAGRAIAFIWPSSEELDAALRESGDGPEAYLVRWTFEGRNYKRIFPKWKEAATYVADNEIKGANICPLIPAH